MKVRMIEEICEFKTHEKLPCKDCMYVDVECKEYQNSHDGQRPYEYIKNFKEEFQNEKFRKDRV